MHLHGIDTRTKKGRVVNDSNMRLGMILVAAMGAMALGASLTLKLYGIADIDGYTQLASTVIGALAGVLVGKNL